MVARMSTRGTKRALMVSARRAMGALDPCAVSTMRTIWARTVSLPTRVARMTKLPLPLRVAPMTGSPTVRITGIDSPVSIDSSTLEAPSTRTPSTGMVSPARTRRRSAGRTSATATSTSTAEAVPGSPSMRCAMGAWSAISARTAPTVLGSGRAPPASGP